MDWTLSAGDFVRVGILVYVGIWIYLRLREYRSDRRPECSVYEVINYEKRGRGFRSVGWVVALIVAVAGIAVSSEVYIVTQHGYVKPENPYFESDSVRKSFNVQRKWVPYYYKGHWCAPFTGYISNETDSTLVLYETTLFNGAYQYVSSDGAFTDVDAHSFMMWNEGIDNSFEKPYGTWTVYVPNQSNNKKNKYTTIWTLDLRKNAIADSYEISSDIRKHNPYLQPGSAMMDRVKRRIDKAMGLDSIIPIDEIEKVEVIGDDSKPVEN